MHIIEILIGYAENSQKLTETDCLKNAVRIAKNLEELPEINILIRDKNTKQTYCQFIGNDEDSNENFSDEDDNFNNFKI